MPLPRSLRMRQPAYEKITEEVERRNGKWPLIGRYHRLPRKLESDYVLTGDVLGTGMNGSVKLAMRRGSLEKYATKQLVTSRLSASDRASLLLEVQVFLCMDHPHIARLVNVYEADKSVDLVMECMAGGELFERCSKKKHFEEGDAAHLLKQMLLAVNYLHHHGIAHRDLKLDNFMYTTKGGNFLKLIDFGLSKFCKEGSRMKTACGTLAYIAPDVLTGHYTTKCDMWSLGVIAFILLTGSMPFPGDSTQVKKRIVEGHFRHPSKWDHLSEAARDFTESLMHCNPNKRLSPKDALEHSWIQSHLQHGKPAIDRSILGAIQNYSTIPKFRRCCLVAMSWYLSDQEIASIRDEFFAIDSTSEGAISLADLKEVMVHRFGLSEEDARAAFQEIDVTGDERIQYSEFLAVMLASRLKPSDDILMTTFRNFDEDLSGFITVSNLHDMFGLTFEGECTKKLLDEVNSLDDGHISYAKFAAYVRGEPVKIGTDPYPYHVRDGEAHDGNTEKAGGQACCTLM